MKQHSLALSMSVVLHAAIILLFFRIPFDRYAEPKFMVLDFSLVRKQHMTGDAERRKETENQKLQSVMREKRSRIIEGHQEKSTAENKPSTSRQQLNIEQNPTASQTNSGTVSDPAGQVSAHGQSTANAQSAASGTKGTDRGVDTQSSGVTHGAKLIDYNQRGLGRNEFPFIEETINSRFKGQYPKRALRMGWEGKVLLSFIIFEDGTIHNIRITKGAAHSDFDDHAMEMLPKIVFKERLPYPLRIENYQVTYRLN